jgi:hypothetical protein
LKKATSILFLFVFLSANTVFGQLLKLPVLVQHYVLHEEENDHHGLLDFLVEHYAEASQHDAANSSHHHENLPFKNAGCTSLHSVITIDEIPVVNFESPLGFAEIKTGAKSQDFYLSTISGNIWQPPRNC